MLTSTNLHFDLEVCSDFKSDNYDSLIIVASSISDIPFKELTEPVQRVFDVDASAKHGTFLVATSNLPHRRIIFSGVGDLSNDYDDVRSFSDAAKKGVEKALAAGSTMPLLFIHKSKFEESATVAVLAAVASVYLPLESRSDKMAKVKKIGIFGEMIKIQDRLELIRALECGRIVSRDIGGSDPETMAPPKVEAYLRDVVFPQGSGVSIQVYEGQSVLEKEYPCLAAVNRAASTVSRHDGRVIWLTYEPPRGEKIDRVLMMVGKGVTYDTGGADIKAGGIMAGMSRDKIGAANAAGIVKALSILKPKGLKVVAALAMVRNSVGSNCYVSDEIITARSGVRIRVGNTDAEGRMAMVDVLCHMKEKALSEPNPHLMTMATLTGHAVLAIGPYSAVMDNGVAKKDAFAQTLQGIGEDYGDPFEISTMRREDFQFIQDKCKDYVDVVQCNNAASSRTPRGHQFPGAFLQVVSGLDKHNISSKNPLKYSHLDIAGSSGDLPFPTTASTVTALTVLFSKKKN